MRCFDHWLNINTLSPADLRGLPEIFLEAVSFFPDERELLHLQHAPLLEIQVESRSLSEPGIKENSL
jgi:hypothetical protein